MLYCRPVIREWEMPENDVVEALADTAEKLVRLHRTDSNLLTATTSSKGRKRLSDSLQAPNAVMRRIDNVFSTVQPLSTNRRSFC